MYVVMCVWHSIVSLIVKLPRELFLGLDMAVFYFFLQLYALYPCKFLQYLKARFGPTGEVEMYTEHIAVSGRHVIVYVYPLIEDP